MISLDNRLDKRKSILSDHRARNWELHDGADDGADDGYLDADMEMQSVSENNQPLVLANPNTPVLEAHKPDKGIRPMKKTSLWTHPITQ